MSDRESQPDDRLEAALRRLTPATPAFDPQRLLFRAGEAAGRRGRRRLALLAGLLGAVCGIAGTYVGFAQRVAPLLPPQVVVVPMPAPPAAPDHQPKQPDSLTSSPETPDLPWDAAFETVTPQSGYLHLRNQALRLGVEALPRNETAAPEGRSPEPADMLHLQTKWIGKASE
jgi:hypothetical protein